MDRPRSLLSAIKHSMILLILLLNSAVSVRAVFLEILVDDNDPNITYTGDWKVSGTHGEAYRGIYHYSNAVNPTAIFVFTGTSISYIAPLWTQPLIISVSLDGVSMGQVNLTNPAGGDTSSYHEDGFLGLPDGSQHDIRWSKTNLTNTRHSVRVEQVTPGSYVVVDGFQYTTDVPDPTSIATLSYFLPVTTPLSPFAETTSSSAEATSTPRERKSQTLPIAIGTGFGGAILVVLLAVGGFLYYRRTYRIVPRVDPEKYSFDGPNTPFSSDNADSTQQERQTGGNEHAMLVPQDSHLHALAGSSGTDVTRTLGLGATNGSHTAEDTAMAPTASDEQKAFIRMQKEMHARSAQRESIAITSPPVYSD